MSGSPNQVDIDVVVTVPQAVAHAANNNPRLTRHQSFRAGTQSVNRFAHALDATLNGIARHVVGVKRVLIHTFNKARGTLRILHDIVEINFRVMLRRQVEDPARRLFEATDFCIGNVSTSTCRPRVLPSSRSSLASCTRSTRAAGSNTTAKSTSLPSCASPRATEPNSDSCLIPSRRNSGSSDRNLPITTPARSAASAALIAQAHPRANRRTAVLAFRLPSPA